MAKIISDDTWMTLGAAERAGWKYPWDEWLDGKTRVLVRGQDFATNAKTMRNTFATAATRRGLRYRTRISRDGTVLCQALRRGETS